MRAHPLDRAGRTSAARCWTPQQVERCRRVSCVRQAIFKPSLLYIFCKKRIQRIRKACKLSSLSHNVTLESAQSPGGLGGPGGPQVPMALFCTAKSREVAQRSDRHLRHLRWSGRILSAVHSPHAVPERQVRASTVRNLSKSSQRRRTENKVRTKNKR